MIRDIDPVRDARRLILFHISCCEQLSALILHEAALQALRLMGQYADQPTPLSEWDIVVSLAKAGSDGAVSRADRTVAQVAREVATDVVLGMATASHPSAGWKKAHDYHCAAVCDLAESVTLSKMKPETSYEAVRVPTRDIGATALQVWALREIFGNPFRPVEFDPTWRTETVLALAETIYESRQFHALPILADALEEAGCSVAQILAHCRQSDTHVRGCWVIDLLLGKQ
jgi:hypothetical protein